MLFYFCVYESRVRIFEFETWELNLNFETRVQNPQTLPILNIPTYLTLPTLNCSEMGEGNGGIQSK